MSKPHISSLSLSELAAELNLADAAIALGVKVRTWKAYRRAILAEIDRKSPVDRGNTPTDAELLAELGEFGAV